MSASTNSMWVVLSLLLAIFLFLLWLAHLNQQRIRNEEQQRDAEIQRIIDSGKDTLATVGRLLAEVEERATTPKDRRRRELREERRYYSATYGDAKYQHNGSRYVIFDLETSGLDATRHSIIEIAAKRYVDDEPIESFETLVRLPTKKKLPPFITELTGITNKILNNEGKEIETAIKEFINFIGDDCIMSYNFDFDGQFLQAAYGQKIPNKSRCIYKMAKSKWKNRSSYKLVDLLESECMTTVKSAHRALQDVDHAHELLITIAYY